MTEKVISIASDFSKTPAGRYPADGPFNGQRFREKLLVPALNAAAQSGDRVVVVLDGALGYSSSFLEEAFGGLVRSHAVARDFIKKNLEVRANDTAYRPAKLDAENYLRDELARLPAA
jgi:hypothetical protein